MRLLVAIPCLNEAKTIETVIKQIPRIIEGIDSVDVLVVDDGSTDGTDTISRAAGAFVVRHPHNRGVGAAFQTAVAYAVDHSYDFMINIDGDGQFTPSDIPKLIDPVLRGRAYMTTASRFKDPSLVPDMPKVKLVGNHMMAFLISRLVRKSFADVACGFRCYSREALLRINLHGAFTYTQETFLDLSAKKLVIEEVPISVKYFADRKSRVAGSIFKYGLSAGAIIFRGYRDYFPLRFFWSISLFFALPAVVLAVIFFGHFLVTGTFQGYLFAGLTAGFLSIISILFLIVGIVADMLDRIRSNQERILYLLRKNSSL